MSSLLWLARNSSEWFTFSFGRGHRAADARGLAGCGSSSASAGQDAAPELDPRRRPAEGGKTTGAGLWDGFSIPAGQSPNAAETGLVAGRVCPSGCCWKRRDAPRLRATCESPGTPRPSGAHCSGPLTQRCRKTQPGWARSTSLLQRQEQQRRPALRALSRPPVWASHG